MTLKFHNTLTGQVDEFVAQTENKVTLYTCGPTVYSYQHVGNWAAYIYWDILVRILMINNYDVTRVMNITDVGHLTSDADEGEDKLEQGARREGKTAWEIAAFYTADFLKGMKYLGMVQPQYIAKATDYVPQQLELVRQLKAKGYTYQINDGIYFDTSKFIRYADFAHLDLAALKAGARVEFNPEKRNHSDFALWKFTPTGEKRDMEWETPSDLLKNGSKVMGFPGWHLECSAIALSLLGNTLDIHTGGIDHIPVHHTNEIAQSESVTGVRFSNYWLHCNHLKVNGTKISKSLGNGYTLDDLRKNGFTPLDYRMFILQGNYRNEGNFSFKSLETAKNRLHKWRNAAALRHQMFDETQVDNNKSSNTESLLLKATPKAIIEAIDNDLGTPEALRIIDNIFSTISNSELANINRQSFIKLLETIDYTLGLQLIDNTPDITDEIKGIMLGRDEARAQKNWLKSDTLRDRLASKGIVLRDNDGKSVWEYKI